MKTFTLRPDGSMESMTLPDGRTETVNTQDPNTQLPTNITRLDNQTQSQSISSAGQTTSQSGAGVTPATYGYDPVTAQLASLRIFPSGSSTNTTGQETTGWKYDPATGLESRKTYADGSTDTFVYNNKLQLSAESLRGNTASFNYNSAGMQTGATYIGGETGTTIYDSLGTLDDLGRSHVMTELTTSAGGQSTSTSDILSYNPQGQVASEAQASGVTVHYDYNADSSIQDMKLYQNGQVISETDYSYDPISKRLQTMTIDGIAYTFAYKPGTNLISSVLGDINPVTYSYESNAGRLSEITALGPTPQDPGLQAEYDASYTYTANDQRLTETVSQENADTQAIDQRNWTFGYDAQDQLTSVSQDGTTLYSYNYDGVGNRTDSGAVNSMNQYGALHYNGQGDVIDDGQSSYTWDAKDRLTSATPDSLNAQSQKDVFTYDPENRRTQEDIYSWDNNNQTWVYASSLKFVYDGSQMVAELDGQNQLLQTYAWGPTGTLLSITDYSWGTKNYQVVTDGSGNVVELLDSSTGLVAASYQYDPWGNPLSATGPAANVSPFRWQGEFYDASFGGYYMGAREGSARLHLFLSPDPSGESSDENLYRPVGNDPINNVDPTGTTQQQALDYFKSLPADVQDHVSAIILIGFDGQVPRNAGYSLTPFDEPYRKYIDQYVNLKNQAFDVSNFYNNIKLGNGLVNAADLVTAGRSLAPTDKIISGTSAPIDAASYVAFGQSLGASNARYVGGYTDEFGSHVSFCMSCHDRSDPGANMKMLAARTGAANSWGVFTSSMTLPLLAGPIADGAIEAVEAAEMASEAAESSAISLSYMGGEPLDLGFSPNELSSLGGQPLLLGEATEDGLYTFGGLQGPEGARPLSILNPGFTPDSAGILQAHVDSVSAALAANPALARQVLSADELVHFLNPSSSTYAATWGKAVERLTAVQIEDNPFSDSFLQHIGGPNEPDFVGRAGTFAEDHMFDITTVQSEPAHYTRWYGQDVYYIHYWRP